MKTLSEDMQSGCSTSAQFNLGAKEQTQLGSYFRKQKGSDGYGICEFFSIYFVYSFTQKYSDIH